MKTIDKQLDVLFQQYILQEKPRCQVCGGRAVVVHHMIHRASKITRWDVKNGVSLCHSHHVANSEFSAHLTPGKFTDWFIAECPEIWDYLQNLKNSNKKVRQWDKEELVSWFKERLST